ncbi:MAG: hypothetical protein U9Q97_06765 [Acidobacteriota bacterium]|nr:hypothetical protein [Acidobacteriota bacterium]
MTVNTYDLTKTSKKCFIPDIGLVIEEKEENASEPYAVQNWLPPKVRPVSGKENTTDINRERLLLWMVSNNEPGILRYSKYFEEVTPVEYKRDVSDKEEISISYDYPILIDSLKKLCNIFVQKVSRIAQVKQVFLTDNERIWTFIAAEPFDRNVRDLIYQVEEEVLELCTEPFVDFRLINYNEFEKDERLHLVPKGSHALFSR